MSLTSSITIIISLSLILPLIITGAAITLGLLCIYRLHLCTNKEGEEHQEEVHDEVMCPKDGEQFKISTNEAYTVLPLMEANVAYGVTCH